MPALLSTGEGVALLTVVAFAAGAAFYSGYRALLYPLLGRIALYLEIRKKQNVTLVPRHFLPWTVPAAELSRDEFRWKLRDESEKGKPKLDEWASQIHLLYTMGFSLWLGSIIGITALSTTKPIEWTSLSFWNFDYRLGVPTMILISAAFVSDRRRRFTEERLYEK